MGGLSFILDNWVELGIPYPTQILPTVFHIILPTVSLLVSYSQNITYSIIFTKMFYLFICSQFLM